MNSFRKILLVRPDSYDSYTWLPLTQSNWKTNPSLSSPLTVLSTNHTLNSIFNARSLPLTFGDMIGSSCRFNRRIFVWLLAESSWRFTVQALENQTQDIRKDATLVAGHQGFESLTNFRRQLADAQWLLADTRSKVEDSINVRDMEVVWDVDGRELSAKEFWSEKRDKPVAVNPREVKSIDVRDIPTLLKELEGRISTMIRTVNEDIQIVIGSVQVEDARVMKRQTEWMVVLTVLAAIYLPMSLVTGIFGMNITDLSAETPAPDKWTVVRTWAVIFGITIGSILVYALVRYVLRYWRVGRMLLKRRIKKVHDGRFYDKFLVFRQQLKQSKLYQKMHDFRKKMKEWDAEAQNMENME
jgi:hypothetical protein